MIHSFIGGVDGTMPVRAVIPNDHNY